MRRRPRTYVISATLAITLAGGLAGCSDSPDDDPGGDTKPGSSGSSASTAAPGRYDTLPEPCGAVSRGTLKRLLPGAESAESGSGGETADPYEGKAKLTYDTDRRVGCGWKAGTPAGTRHLSVDMERVVSYDPSVSDDEQARILYDERAGQADIPSSGSPSAEQTPPDGDGGSPSPEASGSGKPSGDPSPGASQGERAQGGRDGQEDQQGRQGQESQDGRRANGGAGDGSPSSSASPTQDPSGGPKQPAEGDTNAPSDAGSGSGSASPDADLAPRTLDDIGDNAYIDDQLDTGQSGVHRDITLVFRSSNVIATVRYDQWVTDQNQVPDSAELQDKAQAVARELAAGFDEG
ncbi:hypothetical protein [Streptomyces sp. ODS28]|uniref:hypothetical protein n=1 Tax=Streptomyces sp. ODS28 TaxID=3136688 RepID=UPI0031E8E29A